MEKFGFKCTIRNTDVGQRFGGIRQDQFHCLDRQRSGLVAGCKRVKGESNRVKMGPEPAPSPELAERGREDGGS